jgi:hypothetical protein
MRVEVLYFGGCPTYETATKTLRLILAEEGVESEIKLVDINDDEEAQRLRFPGVPPFGSMDETCSPCRSAKTGGWVAECTRRLKARVVRHQLRCSGKH